MPIYRTASGIGYVLSHLVLSERDEVLKSEVQALIGGESYTITEDGLREYYTTYVLNRRYYSLMRVGSDLVAVLSAVSDELRRWREIERRRCRRAKETYDATNFPGTGIWEEKSWRMIMNRSYMLEGGTSDFWLEREGAQNEADRSTGILRQRRSDQESKDRQVQIDRMDFA